jgi:hypothetical protein
VYAFFFVSWFFRCPKTGEKTPRTPQNKQQTKIQGTKNTNTKKNKNTKTHDRTQLSASSPPPLGVFNLIMFGFLVLMFASLGFVCCKKGKKL